MGSYLFTGDIQFHLAKGQFNNALHTLVSAAESYDGIDTERADTIVAYMANTIYTQDPIEKEIAQVIELFNWRVTLNDEGDISDIELIDGFNYPADEEQLFTLLAPYVTQGSFIELEAQEHGNTYQYRYAFTGTRMLEQEAHYDPVPDEQEEGGE